MNKFFSDQFKANYFKRNYDQVQELEEDYDEQSSRVAFIRNVIECLTICPICNEPYTIGNNRAFCGLCYYTLGNFTKVSFSEYMDFLNTKLGPVTSCPDCGRKLSYFFRKTCRNKLAKNLLCPTCDQEIL